MVEDAVLGRDFGAEDFVQFGLRRDAVEAGCDAEGDAFDGDASGVEGLEDDRESAAVGDRAGDVADGDGGGFFALGQLGQGGSADGVEDGVFEGRRFVREGGSRLCFEKTVFKTVGEGYGKASLAKGQIHVHKRTLTYFFASLAQFGPLRADMTHT